MGNTYTNVLLREPNIDRVTALLDQLGRRAYVGSDGAVTVVYDERAERNPPKELGGLASLLSSKLHLPALGVANYHDDVFEYQLAVDGKVVDRYNSYPGFLKGGGETPVGGDARRLCVAFGAASQEAAVAALLRRTRSDMGPDVERHEQLLKLLGLPPALSMLGYDYVREGELAQNVPGATFRTVGGAPEPAPRAESHDSQFYHAALVLNEIDVPPPFAAVLGRGRISGLVAFHRLMLHIFSNGKQDHRPGVWRLDRKVAELLGQSEVQETEISRLLVQALGIPPLTAKELSELENPGSATRRRFEESIRRASSGK
jgi:hypothetical protein